MSSAGFRIAELRVTGKDVEDATVRFLPGLNIIAGPSNTGKSYVFACLKYMLGSKTLPKKGVKQATPYSFVRAQLNLSDGQISVLERSLSKASDVRLYNTTIDNLPSPDTASLLAATHSETDPENISTFLLQASGWAAGLRLLENTSSNKTRPLRFHDIRPFLLVDEMRIISDATPVTPSGQFIHRTVETATFDLLVSGRDWGDVIAKPKKLEVRVATWEARHDTLRELMKPLEESLTESVGPEAIEQDIETTEAHLTVAVQELAEVGTEIKSLNQQRKQLLDERRPKDLRTRVIDQLTRQFDLLRQSYTSDVDRLAFIEETAGFTAQLGTENCPTCGQPLSEPEAVAAHISADDHIQAAKAERAKLTKHLADLARATEDLQSEHTELADEIESLNLRIRDLDSSLESLWRERSKPVEEIVARENERLAKLKRKRDEWKRLEDLRGKLDQLGEKPRRKRKGEKDDTPAIRYPTRERREFCDALRATLERWKLPGAGTVEFGSGMTLIINGIEADSNGKGVRAVIRSAFIVTLMRHCVAKRLPHPRFIVLDSPLTSFKEADREQVGQEVQEAFYDDLNSLNEDLQVVIFENKEPPQHIQESANYECFTKRHDRGRYGFFPT